MAYFEATVEIPFAPPGVNSDHIYELLNDELNNGIYQITEETVHTRGKHKKITVNACCRIHTPFFKEEDENGRVIRYMDYNGKQVRLRMWVSQVV
jgi:hypothetical protein